ncbi:Abi family protein [Companilactobacillus mishanensis]|uniref:Abi family protein n=1 Tax=Companilactobacillus mishanensis TaxID=2486008 RepID=A0A5P0ZIF9_9LACO|nr:Abi family protein [Companilactobacillus mishanensis]MQS52844.1 Abi family protein [Companilactobacillus mishanensis]
MEKPFLKIEHQIDLLKHRGLIIDDVEYCESKLKLYGYYEIINGYKQNFLKVPENDETGFKEGTTFKQIYNLFQTDQFIRASTMDLLECFEANLRQSIAYVISDNISVDDTIYTRPHNYKPGSAYRYNGDVYHPRDYLLTKMHQSINSRTQPFAHYRNKFGNVPPWIMIKGLTFGSLVKLCSLLRKNEKDQVIDSMMCSEAVKLLSLNEKKQLFGDTLNLMLKYRNVCAHGGRVFNHRSQESPIRYSRTFHGKNDLNITRRQYNKGTGRSSIGVLLCSLELYKNQEYFKLIFKKIASNLQQYITLHESQEKYIYATTEIRITWIQKYEQ